LDGFIRQVGRIRLNRECSWVGRAAARSRVDRRHRPRPAESDVQAVQRYPHLVLADHLCGPVLPVPLPLRFGGEVLAQHPQRERAARRTAAEISQRVFEQTGDLQPTSRTWANAQAFASMNNGYLAQYGVYAVVTGITVDIGEDTVLVQVSANLERLFPSVVPDVTVIENGYAEIRAFTR